MTKWLSPYHITGMEGTMHGAVDSLESKLWRVVDGPRGTSYGHRGTMYGAVDGQGGPIIV